MAQNKGWNSRFWKRNQFENVGEILCSFNNKLEIWLESENTEFSREFIDLFSCILVADRRIYGSTPVGSFRIFFIRRISTDLSYVCSKELNVEGRKAHFPWISIKKSIVPGANYGVFADKPFFLMKWYQYTKGQDYVSPLIPITN